jgi:hypothetical protein
MLLRRLLACRPSPVGGRDLVRRVIRFAGGWCILERMPVEA